MGRHWFSVFTLACLAACGGQSVYTEGGEAGAGDGGGGSSGKGGRGGDTGGSTTGGSSTGGTTGGSSTGAVGGVGAGGSVSTGGVGTGGSVVTGGVGGKGASGGTGGTGIVCPVGYSLCGGTCVDVLRDPSACGACGQVCPPDAICNQGICESLCPPDLWTCGGACVDLVSDPNNCGECGVVCTNGSRCSGGTCSFSCGGTLADCGDYCADLRFDPYNCGLCGNVCEGTFNATTACEMGACRYFCDDSFADCNGSGFDGCETNYASDPQNCGSCGKVCGDGQTCEKEQCVGSTATYHWELVTTTACNAWCGQAPDPLDTCGGPWLCNSASVGGYIWVYRGGPMPPPNPASQSSSGYGWAHWWCDQTTCGGPGPAEGSCAGEPAENAIYQCVYE